MPTLPPEAPPRIPPPEYNPPPPPPEYTPPPGYVPSPRPYPCDGRSPCGEPENVPVGGALPLIGMAAGVLWIVRRRMKK